MTQYEPYILRAAKRPVFAVYDNLAGRPVCKRDDSPYTTTDRVKAARLARELDEARDAASIASALISFGSPQGEAWRYAQTIYAI